MKTVLLFGGTGNLGRHIAAVLQEQGYYTKAIVRTPEKAEKIRHLVNEIALADATRPETLDDAWFKNVDVIISALGKSVSLNDPDKASFRQVDYQGNMNILQKAKQGSVAKFIYVSAFNAENFPQLEYFKSHVDFSRALAASELAYTIIKPPAIMSAFTELLEMARKGRLSGMGKGDHRTNPVYEGDLAKVCVTAIGGGQTTVEAGGKHVYTRRQILDIINAAAGTPGPVRMIPTGLVKTFLPLLRLFSRNLYDKMSFYLAVNEEDVLAPPLGELSLEAYFSPGENGQV